MDGLSRRLMADSLIVTNLVSCSLRKPGLGATILANQLFQFSYHMNKQEIVQAMSMAPASQSSDLFSDALIQSYIDGKHFVERPWLAEQIGEALADPTCRFLLLTAAPGAGKTAFMAWLAHRHTNWPRYFIRRDQRTPLGDVGARSLLLQIGFQLAASHPTLFTQEQMRLVIEQRIETVDPTGEAVGAEIKKIFASPFYHAVVQIQQQVTQNSGKVIGIRVAEWITDPRLLSIDDLQYMAFIDPARVLLKQHPDEQIVILVDALDELRYHDTDQTLLSWLSTCPELPPNVRFVLTSRPDDDLLQRFRETQQPWLQMKTIDTSDPNVLLDLQRYALSLTSEQEVKAALEHAGQTVEGFIRQIVDKAAGNIGYLDAMSRAIDRQLVQHDQQALAYLLSLSELPDTLEGLYAFFLHQLKNLVGRKSIQVDDPQTGEVHFLSMWSSVYQRILGVLTVAREALTARQIRDLGAIQVEWSDFCEALNSVQQFLNREGDRYSLYHTTLIDFLTGMETKQTPDVADLYVEATTWHRLIVMYYRGGKLTWEEVAWSEKDNYGLRHLASHLYALRTLEAYRHDLYTLICKPFVVESFTRFVSLQPISDNVALALEMAENEVPSNLVQISRGSLLYTTLSQLASHIPLEALYVLVQTGQESVAIAWASMIKAPLQGKVYAHMSSSLFLQGKLDQARALLKHATLTPGLLARAGEIDRAFALFDSTGVARGRPEDLALPNVETAKKYEEGIAITEVLEVLTTVGPIERARVFIDSLEDGYAKAVALSEVAQALTRAGNVAQALEVSSTISDAYRKAITLSRIAQTIVQLRMDGDAQKIAQQALAVAEAIVMTPQNIFGEGDKVIALCEVAQALAQAGKSEDMHALAIGVLTEAEERAVIAKGIPANSNERPWYNVLAKPGKSSSITILPRLKKTQKVTLDQVSMTKMNTLLESEHPEEIADILAEQEEAGREWFDSVAGLSDQETSLVGVSSLEMPRERSLEAFEEPREQSGRDAALKARIKQLLQEEGGQVLVEVRKSEPGKDQSETVEQVASRQAQIQADLTESQQNFLAMLEQASREKEEYNRAYLLEKVVQAWAKIGRIDNALEAVQKIQREVNKTSALCKVARILIQAGNRKQAEDLANQALEVARSIHSAISLGEVARVLFEAGAVKDAECITGEALDAIDAMTDENKKASTLCEVTALLALWMPLDQVLTAANQATREFRSSLLANMAQALLQVGRKEPTQELATQALKEGLSLRSRKYFVEYSFSTLVQLGNVRGVEMVRLEGSAEGIMDKVRLSPSENMELAAMTVRMDFQRNVLEDVWQRKINALRSVARALAEVGRPVQSQIVARAFTHPYWKATTFSDIASILAQIGLIEPAKTAALQAADLVEDWMATKTHAFNMDTMQLQTEAAYALVHAGEIERAQSLANQAFEFAQENLSASLTSTEVFHSFIQLLIQFKEKEHLLRLASQAIELAEKDLPDLQTDELFSPQSLDLRNEAEYIIAQVELLKNAPSVSQKIIADQEKVVASSKTLLAGEQDQVLSRVKTAFKDARLVGRDSVFEVLEREASTVSILDQGTALWHIYEAMQEADNVFGIP